MSDPPQSAIPPFVSRRRDVVLALVIAALGVLFCTLLLRMGADHPAVTEPWDETRRLAKDVVVVVLYALPAVLWLASVTRVLDGRRGAWVREALLCVWVALPPAALAWAAVADLGLPALVRDALGGFLLVSEPTAAACLVFALASLVTLGQRLANDARHVRWAEARGLPADARVPHQG